MPSNINTANKELYGMLHSNGFDPTPLDASGDDAGLPENADVFQVMTKNGSPVTVTITSDRVLRVYYSKKSTEDEGWYAPDGLLHKLRDFVRQHRLAGFEPDPQNDNKNLKYDMAKRAEMKQEELSLNEGYYPIGKRASGNNGIPSVTIVIQHNRQLGEGEQRFRNVEKIFIENADGERFRSPTNSPGLSKVFARLIAEGDKPHGENWNHLVSLIEDYSKLRGFVRATKNGVFNESAQRWVEAGTKKYYELRESLKSLMSSRGYRAYFESWTPTLNESSDEGGVDLTEMFQTSVLDARVEAALPVIKRLGVVVEAKLESSLEEWAGQVEREAVYGVEDRSEGKLDEGCDCGPDCDCPDCEEHNAKKEVDEAELTPKQKKLDKNKNSRIDAEDFKMLRSKKPKEVEEGYGEDPRGGRYGKMGAAKATPVKSNLTPAQSSAGQVSATEPTKPTGKILGAPQKKHPFQDRLVGESESTADPLADIRRLIGRK